MGREELTFSGYSGPSLLAGWSVCDTAVLRQPEAPGPGAEDGRGPQARAGRDPLPPQGHSHPLPVLRTESGASTLRPGQLEAGERMFRTVLGPGSRREGQPSEGARCHLSPPRSHQSLWNVPDGG